MPKNRRDLGRSFARRIYGPRALGCLLSALFVGTVQYADPATSLWVWIFIGLNAFVWPTAAYVLAHNAADSYAVERRNFALDSLFAGLWAGQMAFNLLPSVLLLSMVSMNAMAAGGWRLLRTNIVLQAIGLLTMLGARGFDIRLDTSYPQVLACLPMLIIYPPVVSSASYRLAVQLAVHKKAFKLISTQDGMTRLLHHAAWMERLNETFPRCRTGEVVAVLALIDIDNFKSINDNHGHLVGDAVITRLANLLRAELGERAIPGRYGGDEFCVLLLDIDVNQAYERLDNIRKRFGDWTDGTSPVRASLSVGMVPYSSKFTNAHDWLHATDAALYRAKRNGKNHLWSQALAESEASG